LNDLDINCVGFELALRIKQEPQLPACPPEVRLVIFGAESRAFRPGAGSAKLLASRAGARYNLPEPVKILAPAGA
jgi:hypothetical protein